MALEDVQKSIAWAKSGGHVRAYLTAHYGSPKDDQSRAERDTVRYAYGRLEAEGNALVGNLTDVYANTGTRAGDPGVPPAAMERKAMLSFRVELHPEGQVGIQAKMNGKPIGGVPVEVLPASAVGAGLLRAASTSTAYAISLDRRPAPELPPN